MDVLGISHMHGDHIGQAAQFTNARLLMGKGDFEGLAGRPEDTFKGWRGAGKSVTLANADVDVFGDGSVVALHLPGPQRLQIIAAPRRRFACAPIGRLANVIVAGTCRVDEHLLFESGLFQLLPKFMAAPGALWWSINEAAVDIYVLP